MADDAVKADAHQRLAELTAARRALLPDADDLTVLSELTMIESQIWAAQRALGNQPQNNLPRDDRVLARVERASGQPSLRFRSDADARQTRGASR